MKRIIFLMALLLVFISCEQKPYQTLQKQLDNYFSNRFSEDEPGGAILVLKGEKILFEKGYGLADLKSKEKITPKTVFNLGSISKTFVANGILILMQEGKLSINDNLFKYFPNFKHPELAKKIKLVNLLSHSSGIIDSRKVAEDSVFYLTAKDRENFYPITQNDSLAFNPGEKFQYSNPAFNGLALIIEKTANMKWQRFIKERIFMPSKMLDSKITDGAFPQDGVAHGYVRNSSGYREYDFGEYPTFCAAGNGGVWSSVEDLVNYELALRQATFLSAEMIKKSREVFVPQNWRADQPPQIGYSWFINEMDGLKQVGHTGSQGGFISDYVSIPEKQILYLCLCNTPKPIRIFRKEVFKILAENGFMK